MIGIPDMARKAVRPAWKICSPKGAPAARTSAARRLKSGMWASSCEPSWSGKPFPSWVMWVASVKQTAAPPRARSV